MNVALLTKFDTRCHTVWRDGEMVKALIPQSTVAFASGENGIHRGILMRIHPDGYCEIFVLEEERTYMAQTNDVCSC